MKAKAESQVRAGSGNVFEDLGLSTPDDRLVKAKLAAQIAKVLARRALTQAAAARVLRIDQPKVSALLRGRALVADHEPRSERRSRES
jgi:predicted XRE-type DNA-binding protein